MITELFLRLGLTRDSLWFWSSRIAALCALIASHVFDLGAEFERLGWPIGPTGVRRLEVVAIIILWLSGRYDSSPLPGK